MCLIKIAAGAFIGFACVADVCAGEKPGPPPCFPQAEVILEENVVDAALGDVDGDAFDDVFALRPPLIEILRNDGQGYVPYATIDVGEGPTRIETAKITFDSFPDIVLLRGSVVLLYVSFDGTYPKSPTNTFTLPAAPGEFVVADLEGDDDADVAVTLPTLGQVMILYHDVTGAVDHTETINLGGEPDGIAAGDVNGDGANDLVVRFDDQTAILLLLNKGGGGFDAVPIEIGGESYAMLLTDLNGDGKSELTVIGRSDDGNRTLVQILPAMGGTFGSAAMIPLNQRFGDEFGLAPVDLESDGDVDLVIGFESFYALQQLVNDGDGNFTIGVINTNINAHTMLPTDIDRDGKSDLLAMPITRAPSTKLYLVRDNDLSGQGFEGPYGGWVFGQDVAIDRADLNNDGIDDLIGSAEGDVIVRWGGPRNDFSIDVLFEGEDLIRPVAADVTGDGLVDIYASSPTQPKLLIQRKDGSFLAVDQALPPSDDGAFGDFNGDGALDVVSKRSLAPGTDSVHILTNAGGGELVATLALLTRRVEDIAAGDFNGDGFADIAIGGEESIPGDDWDDWPYHVFGYMLNDGSGGFLPDQWIRGGESGHAIALADYDNDGVLDAVVSYEGFRYNAHVRIYDNDGTGDFDQLVPAGENCCLFGEGAAFADIDADGTPDLISGSDGGLWIYHAVVPGEYESWQVFGQYSSGLRTPLVGDYDGDGRLDIAVILADSGVDGAFYVLFGDCAPICRGDVDLDRNVDVFDLFELLSDWGPCPNGDSDLDHDSMVGNEDLMNLLASWGQCPV